MKNLFRKNFVLLLVVVLTIIGISSTAFAAYSVYSCKKVESKTFFQSGQGATGSVGYDYGTGLPFDDASVTTQSIGPGTNYVYASVYFGQSGAFYNTFSKTNGVTAKIFYVSTGYDYMTGTIREKNTNLNGLELKITN